MSKYRGLSARFIQFGGKQICRTSQRRIRICSGNAAGRRLMNGLGAAPPGVRIAFHISGIGHEAAQVGRAYLSAGRDWVTPITATWRHALPGYTPGIYLELMGKREDRPRGAADAEPLEPALGERGQPPAPVATQSPPQPELDWPSS